MSINADTNRASEKRLFGGKEYILRGGGVFRTKSEADATARNVGSSGYFTRVVPATKRQRDLYGARYAVYIRWNKLPVGWDNKKTSRRKR